MPDAPPPIRVLATGPDWTWYCDATIAMHATDHSRKRGQCRCGWKTADVHPSQVRELLDLCEQHLATSAQRRDEYRRSLSPSTRTLEELDAEINAGLDAMHAIVGGMEQRYG
jgi:hypothetical protein